MSTITNEPILLDSTGRDLLNEMKMGKCWSSQCEATPSNPSFSIDRLIIVLVVQSLNCEIIQCHDFLWCESYSITFKSINFTLCQFCKHQSIFSSFEFVLAHQQSNEDGQEQSSNLTLWCLCLNILCQVMMNFTTVCWKIRIWV